MADLTARPDLGVLTERAALAGSRGRTMDLHPDVVDALVAVVRAAERYRQCAMVASGGDLPEADDLADEAFDDLCIALASFGADRG